MHDAIRAALNDLAYDNLWVNAHDMYPKFKHDCDKCQFIGGLYRNGCDYFADIYMCGYTVLFRYSDEPDNYWSQDMRDSIRQAMFYGSRYVKMAFAIYCTVTFWEATHEN